jgi:high affinity Mn2+ porin
MSSFPSRRTYLLSSLPALTISCVLIFARTGSAQTTSKADSPQRDLVAKADPIATTMFAHPNGTRYYAAGQANIIFQAHGPFHSPYAGVNSMLGRGEYKTSLIGTLFLGAEL